MIFRMKQVILSCLYWLDQQVPADIGIWLRNRCFPWYPVLDVVEFHLTDQCNMNCTGCSHYSPFAEKWLADRESVQRDLAALRMKFKGGIRHVNLLGGEPLLHPDLIGFLRCVKETCPETLVTIVTNGILLLKQSEEFWQACRDVGCRINVSLYGPVAAQRADIEAKGRRERVPIRINVSDVFFARMVPDGSVCAKSAFRFCRRTTYCPYLREGRLYPCAQAYHIRDFARACKKELEADAGIDIHSSIGAVAILRYLLTPSVVCRYCKDRARLMRWRNSSHDVSEWLFDEAAPL